MNYIESIKSHPLKNFWNSLSLLKLSSYCKELIKVNLGRIEYLRRTVDNLDKQLTEWEKIQSEEPEKNYREFIETFSILKNFYEDNGILILISIDVTECFKHLIRSRDDWEYRFFARQLYTLMHETRDALMKSLGSHRKQMMELAPTTFSQYEKTKKSLDVFFNTNGPSLKNIRNTTDAHKGEAFRKQIQCIEGIDITKSFELIHEFQVNLANLSASLMIIANEMAKSIGKLSSSSKRPILTSLTVS